MHINWYPWQLFVRKLELMVPLAIAGVGSISLNIYMLLRLSAVTPPLFVHYSVELGVDAIGGKFLATLVSVSAILFVVVNTIVTNVLLLQEKNVARIVAWSTLPLISFAWFCGVLIVRVNGA